MSAAERIAVTGVGIISALGATREATMKRLVAGARGISEVTLFDVSRHRCRVAGQLGDLCIGDVAPSAERDSWSRTDAMAMIAAREAVHQAGAGDGPRWGVAVGATTGGMFEAENVLAGLSRGERGDSARRLLAYPLSTTADRIAAELGAREVSTICSACSSGAVSVVQGAAWLRAGRVDCALVGGADGLCQLTFTGFNALGALDPEPCRPFDRSRSGLNLGEGAAFLVLERERDAVCRGASVLAWLSGWSVGAEAHHITHPEPTGATAARLMLDAVARAGLEPTRIDYVNAHGTGTPQNDAMEARALCEVFGESARSVLVSSSKAQVGHTLGAAGAIEAAITVCSIASGAVPPTVGLTEPENDDIGFVIGGSRAMKIRSALSSSFGFGGTGCVLCFEHEAAASSSPSRSARGVGVRACVAIGAEGVASGSALAGYVGDPGPARATIQPEKGLDPSRSRRFDRQTALLVGGAAEALAAAGLHAENVGLVAGNAFGNVQRCVRFLERVGERGPRFAPPAEFPHLVPSAPTGNASIYLGVRGPVLAVSELDTSGEAALHAAFCLVESGQARPIVAGGAEARDDVVEAMLGPLFDSRGSRTEGGAFLVVEPMLPGADPPLAEVVAWLRVSREGRPSANALGAPATGSPVVVAPSDDAIVDEIVGGTPWETARRFFVAGSVARNEALGAVVVAAGVGLLIRGDASEALAVGVGRRISFTLLRRPAP